MDTCHQGKISPQRRLDQRIFSPGNSFCPNEKGKKSNSSYKISSVDVY